MTHTCNVHAHAHVYVQEHCPCACHACAASQLLSYSPLPGPRSLPRFQRCNVRTTAHNRTAAQPHSPASLIQVLRLSELPFYDLAGLLTPLIASSLGAPTSSVRSFLHLNERAACRHPPPPLAAPWLARAGRDWPGAALRTREELFCRTVPRPQPLLQRKGWRCGRRPVPGSPSLSLRHSDTQEIPEIVAGSPKVPSPPTPQTTPQPPSGCSGQRSGHHSGGESRRRSPRGLVAPVEPNGGSTPMDPS